MKSIRRKIFSNLLLVTIFFFSLKDIQALNTSIICGTIKSSGKFNVNIYEPVFGFYNLAFFDSSSSNSCLINGTDSLRKIIHLDYPSFIAIYFTDEKKQFITRSDILLFPGDSIHLNFDLNHDDFNSVIYGGNNSMGQKLFNEINFQPYNKFIPVFDALDKLPKNKNNIVSEIEDIVVSIKNRFDSLQKKALVTDEFIEYMNVCFKSLMYDQVVLSLLRESKKKNVISRETKDSIITALYKDQPPSDKRLKGLYGSYFYLYNFYGFLSYKKYKLSTTDELKSKKINYSFKGHSYTIKEDFVPLIYIENERDKKDLWALYILLLFNYPGKYDASIIAQYDSIFPHNKWRSLLVNKFKKSGIPQKIEYKLQSPIHFVDTNGVATIKDLLNNLPENKPVFIDIWATWCGPCVSAFGFNQQLDSFLIKNNIERLYISLDGLPGKSKWKQAIERYALGGYHILASDKLREDIKQNIYHANGNEGIPIPRYLFFNNGKILVDDAFSPTEFEFLKKQILAVLNH